MWAGAAETEEDFKAELYSQLKKSGVVSSLKVCARSISDFPAWLAARGGRASIAAAAVLRTWRPAAFESAAARRLPNDAIPTQTQLRMQLLNKLKAKGSVPDASPSHLTDRAISGSGGGLIAAHRPADQPHAYAPPHAARGRAPRLWRAAMDALVADHLAACGLACSLSVFAAEAGLPSESGGAAAASALGGEEVLELLRLGERQPAAAAALRGLEVEGGACLSRSCCHL